MSRKFKAERRSTITNQNLEEKYKERLRSLKKYNYCIILPDDPWKLRWDLFISVLIIWTCIGSPLSLAFTQNDNNIVWIIADSLTDFCFLFDIIFTFRSAYFNSVERLVDSLKEIQCHYLNFWFWVDVVAILPIGIILNRASNPNSLIRITRISRFYRMVKMIKLLRMMRLMKNRRQYARFVRSVLKISIGLERLFIFAVLSLLLCHMSSCIWYFIAQSGSGLYQDSWVVRYGYQGNSLSQIYLAGFYFTITTITTVGYGDISAGNPQEQVYCLCLMIIGVVAYSFAIGSLTGIIQSMDSKASKVRQKIDILSNIRAEYKIDIGLYWRLRESLYYERINEMQEKEKFMAELPTSLRVDLSQAIYHQVVQNIDYFKDKSDFFIAEVVPKLKKLKFKKGESFFRRGNPIDGIYFLSEGEASYVEKIENFDVQFAKHERGSFFGYADFFKSEDDNDNLVAKRTFTIKADTNCTTMFLSKVSLLRIGHEFLNPLSELFHNSVKDQQNLKKMREEAVNWYYTKNPLVLPTNSFQKIEMKKMGKKDNWKHNSTKSLIEKEYSEGKVKETELQLFIPSNEEKKDRRQSIVSGAGINEAHLMLKLEEVLKEMRQIRSEVRSEIKDLREELGLKSVDGLTIKDL